MNRETESAWLAGSFDGEGCIFVGKNPWIVSLIFCNTNKEYVLQFATLVSAHVRVGRHEKGRKVGWVAVIQAHEKVLSALERMEPYLIVKQEKALGAIKAIKSHDWSYSAKLSSERMKRLKKEGKIP